MDKPKAPGQLAFEGHGGLTCAWESLLPSERVRWERAERASQEPLLASHLAMQHARSDLPTYADISRAFNGEPGARHGVISCVLDLFVPHFARLRQERDEERERANMAERQRDELQRVMDTNIIPRSVAAEQKRDALRARIAELEASREPAADVDNRGGYDQEQHPQNNYYDERAGIEPGADVVERLAEVHVNAEFGKPC